MSQPSQLSNFMGFSLFRSNSAGPRSLSEDHSHSEAFNASRTEEPVEVPRNPFSSEAGGLSSSLSSAASSGTSAPAHDRSIFLDFPVAMRRIMLSAHSLPSSMWAVRGTSSSIPHANVTKLNPCYISHIEHRTFLTIYLGLWIRRSSIFHLCPFCDSF